MEKILLLKEMSEDKQKRILGATSSHFNIHDMRVQELTIIEHVLRRLPT